MSGPLYPDVGVIGVVPERWGGMWLSRQQILTRLARYYHVVWVDPPLSWRYLWSGRTPALNHRDTTPAPTDGFEVYGQNLLLPNIHRPAALGRFNASERLRRARRSLERRGCRKFVLYVWQPRFADALDMVDHDISCYHIADEYSFSDAESPITPRERHLIESVDQVFIHSPALLEKKGGINTNTEYVTNGVDFGAFAADYDVPGDMADIPQPRIGYVGRIKVQLDWDVLTHLASAHPDWSFVFVGPIGHMGDRRAEKDALFARDNVYYLGNKSVREIPAYTRHMDVCLLSYAVNNYTRYIFPLKLHECLAAGKPVVGSDIPSLRSFEQIVTIAATPREWSEGVSKYVQADAHTDDAIAERRDVARDFDWNVLVERIARTLGVRLGLDWEKHEKTERSTGHEGASETATERTA